MISTKIQKQITRSEKVEKLIQDLEDTGEFNDLQEELFESAIDDIIWAGATQYKLDLSRKEAKDILIAVN